MTELEISPGIAADPKVSFGKPVIKGTRISIDLVMDQLAARASYEEVQQTYKLTRQNILDVLGYAAEIISQEVVVARAR
jgi:uncharacterized protein (DUF433 family)